MTVLGMAALAFALAERPAAPPPRWLVRRSRESVLVRQSSPDGPMGRAFEDPPMLALLCRRGVLSAGVLPNVGLVPAGDPAAVAIRAPPRFAYRLAFDGGIAPERYAALDAELPEIVVRDAARFVEDLLSHHTLSVTVTPSRTRSARTATFTLDGLRDVIGPVLAACPAEGAPPASVQGSWEVEAEGDRVFVSQVAPVDWPSGDGSVPARPELILRCAGGEKEAYLFARHGFAEREGELLVRFEDQGKPKRYWGAPSRDGRSLFLTGYWSKGTEGFVKALLRHRTLSVVVKPRKRRPLPEAIFDLSGLDEALLEWKRVCPLD